MCRAALEHLQQVGARDARAQKAIAVNFPNMCDLIADRCNLVEGNLEPLFRVVRPTEAATGLRPKRLP